MVLDMICGGIVFDRAADWAGESQGQRRHGKAVVQERVNDAQLRQCRLH